MSLEEFDLLEIPVLGCFQVAHVRHRRSNQGADTFGVPTNSVIITALAAIAGSLVGALGSAVGTWITARHQDRRDLLGKQIARREALYSDFIGESARLLVDAMQHNVSDLQKLLPVYALLSRIRLSSSEPVLQTAEKVIKTIVNTYPQPNLTADQIESRAVNGQNQICANHAQNERHAHEIKERKEEQGIREKTAPDDELQTPPKIQERIRRPALRVALPDFQ